MLLNSECWRYCYVLYISFIYGLVMSMCVQKRQAKYNYRPLYVAILAQSCATMQVWRVVTTSFFHLYFYRWRRELATQIRIGYGDPVRLSFLIATLVDRNYSHCFRMSPEHLIIESWLLSFAHSKWLLYWWTCCHSITCGHGYKNSQLALPN